MQGELQDPWRAGGLVSVAVWALVHCAPVPGSVPRSCLPHGAEPQPVGGWGSHGGQTGRCCWRLNGDWGVMRVSAGHYEATGPVTPTKATMFHPSPHGTEGGVESCLPGERSAGGGAGERAPRGSQWGQVALLQLFHQLFLCQAACWGGKEVGSGNKTRMAGQGKR